MHVTIQNKLTDLDYNLRPDESQPCAHSTLRNASPAVLRGSFPDV